jgi:hypothetical protein
VHFRLSTGDEFVLLEGMSSGDGLVFHGRRWHWVLALMLFFSLGVDGFAAVPKPAKPKITEQPPLKQVVPLGSSGSFVVVVTSDSPVSYQWRRNKINILGATDNVYWITPITADSAGKYDVVITNRAGSVTSKGTTLSVDFAPYSLPMGTALYDGVKVRMLGTSSDETGSWVVTGAVALVDPEDSGGVYTFAYSYVSANHATFTVAGHFYDEADELWVGTTLTYQLVFTGVSPSGERQCKCTGKGAIIAPAGYRPAQIPFSFSGTTSIDLP